MMEKKFLVEIPYRKHTSAEREKYWHTARTLRTEAEQDEQVWKSCREEGLGVMERIRVMGYEFTEPREQGDSIDGYYESASIILPEGSGGLWLGTMKLWGSGGFIEEPIRVIAEYSNPYANDRQIEKAVKLHIQLLNEGIPHSFHPSMNEIERARTELTRQSGLLDKIKKEITTSRM